MHQNNGFVVVVVVVCVFVFVFYFFMLFLPYKFIMASHFQLCAWRITLNTFYFGSKPHHPSLCSYFRGAATNSHHEFSCEDFLLLILTPVCWRQILLWNLSPLELRLSSVVIATTIDSMLIVGRTDLCFLRIHLSQEATLLGLPPLLSFFELFLPT